MFESVQANERRIRALFTVCVDAEARYHKIIELGRLAPPLPESAKQPQNKVSGCQSAMYLSAEWNEDSISFQAEADALISNGLGVLLTSVYSGEPPEVILKYEPKYLEELGIYASLSPSRANGLSSLFLQMRREALRLLLERSSLKA